MINRLKRAKELASFLYAQRIKGFTAPDRPHMDAPSYERFMAALAGAKLYLEFGSGGSTVEAAKLGIETICIESDRFYAQVIRDKIGATAPIIIIDANIGETEAWGQPIMRTATPERVARWTNYTKLAFEKVKSTGQFPQLILVDGRFRRACALESARQAGLAEVQTLIFFDDYFDRPHYHSVEAHLGQPERVGRSALFSIDGKALPAISMSVIAEAQSEYY
jgi:hypothetical protein